MERDIRTVAVIGTGVIGASWAALFLAKGLHVVATDVAPDGDARLRRGVDAAWPALERLGLDPRASRDNLTYTADLAAAVGGADFIQENGPERIEAKRALYEQIDDVAAEDVIIASSSSGLFISEIQTACKRYPERCVLGHPFNPPHLIPIVEVVGGRVTSAATVEAALAFYQSIGKRTVHLRKEIPGHIANRLQAALWREVIHLVASDVVSVADADATIAWGLGIRWGIMGPNMLFHIGGGEGGMEQFLKQFTGPANAWFATLGAPILTPEIGELLIAGVHEAAGGRPIAALAAARDDALIDILATKRRLEEEDVL